MTIRIGRIERSGEGAEEQMGGSRADLPDPAVEGRVESRVAGVREIATSFVPTAERPRTFPASLPFVPQAESHTNEYPNTARAARVRWVTARDPQRVFDEAARQSVVSGWRSDPAYEPPRFDSAVRILFLRRSDRVRRISHHEFEGTSIIELEDAPLRAP
jgi:hypothetical protein